MELKAVMNWISRLKSRDSAGSSLGTEQALIMQLLVKHDNFYEGNKQK